jgi:hypothetical protein
VARFGEATIAPVRIWPDSKNYEAIGSKPLWSSSFWFGGRPSLAPFLWKLTGTPDGFVIGQTLISVFSWGLLAWTVGSLFPAGWKRMLGFSVVLAFAVSKPIALWDGSVLSESLALSGLALLFAASIRLAQKPTAFRAAVFVLAAFWCAIARDTQIVLPALLGLAVMIVALMRRRTARFMVLLLTACALLSAAGFCLTTVVVSGRDAVNTSDNLDVRVFPYPARVAWFAAHGMPEGRLIDKLASSEPVPAGTSKAVFPDLASPAYARLKTWIHHQGSTTYAQWMVTHPWLLILEPLQEPQESFGNASQGVDTYEATNTASFGLTPVFWLPGIWLVPIALGALAIAYRRGLRVTWVVRAVVALGLIGLPVMLVAWNGDGEETTRHTFEGLAEIHLGVLIALLYVVLAPRVRRARSRVMPHPTIPATTFVASPDAVLDATPRFTWRILRESSRNAGISFDID